MLRLVTAIAAAFGLTACAAFAQTDEKPVRVLYLSQSVGFVHETVNRQDGALSPSETALSRLAQESGALDVAFSQDAAALSPETLAAIDVLMISTTGALPIGQETFQALYDWLRSGRGGVVAVHSATDTALAFEGGDDVWARFIGGRFLDHPWTQGTPIRLNAVDPDHPLVASWIDDPLIAEEIYQYQAFIPEEVRVLQTLDMSYGPLRRPWSVPVTWVKEIGAGRLFYTNLGHTPSTWEDPRFRRHLLDAVLWAAGRRDASASPNPEVQAVTDAEAFLAARNMAASPQAVQRLADQSVDIRRLQSLERRARTEGRQEYQEAIERLAHAAVGQD